MIPPRHADRLAGGILLLVAVAALALLGGMVRDAWRYYHPAPKPAPVAVVRVYRVPPVCEYTPLAVVCRDSSNVKDRN